MPSIHYYAARSQLKGRKMILLTSGDVCKILSTQKAAFPHKTLDNWVKQGIVIPVVDARGTGNHRMFTISQGLGLAVARGLRSVGVSHKAAGTVLEFLMNASEEDLLDRFERGRCYVVIIQDEVCPELMTKKVFENYSQGLCKETGLLPIAVDVRAVYERIQTVLKLKEEQPA